MAKARKEENRGPNSVSSSPTIGKNIRDIPIDLINEILLSMDAKTLCLLRCVSRWWNAHISSPTFRHLHYHRSLLRGWLLLFQVYCNSSKRDPSEYEYVFSSTDSARPSHRNLCAFDYPEKIIMEATGAPSCFGLIWMNISIELYRYIPTTRSIFSYLPPFNYACEPKLALGFAHSTNQFKVVCFCLLRDSAFNRRNKNYVDCKVLTIPEDLSTGWRAVPSPRFLHFPNLAVASSESAVYALNLFDWGLFRFDLKTERWSSVKLPPSVKPLDNIGEFEESLCFVGKKSAFHDEVWLLNLKGSTWVIKWALYKIPPGTLLIPLHQDKEHKRILMMTLHGMLEFYHIEEGLLNR